jgi:hypothetical protein
MDFTQWERQRFHWLLWLFPTVYAFHIWEESAGFAHWVTHVLHGRMDVRGFYLNNTGFMAVLLILTTLAWRKKAAWAVFLLFLWTSGQQFWNFVFHIYAQHRFAAYSPGYYTSIFLYLPVYGYLSYLSLREGFLRVHLWLLCLVAGSFGMAFVIWGGLYRFGPFPWERWLPA